MKVVPPAETTVDQPPMTSFIDIIFQLLIYFMLTLQFKSEEGQIMQYLPKNRGLSSAPPTTTLQPAEVRINICAHTGKRFDQHIGLKIRHQQMLDALQLEGQPVGDICYVWIGENYSQGIAELYDTTKHSDKYNHNRQIYTQISEIAMSFQQELTKQNKEVSIIIDADGLARYEHIFGFISALSSKGVKNLDLAGNPKLQKAPTGK